MKEPEPEPLQPPAGMSNTNAVVIVYNVFNVFKNI